MTRIRPPSYQTEPPPLAAGQERRWLRPVGTEDCDAAMARAQLTMPWGDATVGRPVRTAEWWVFVVKTSRLAAMPAMRGAR